MGLQLLQDRDFISITYPNPEVGLLGHMVILIFLMFSMVAAQIYIPTNSA